MLFQRSGPKLQNATKRLYSSKEVDHGKTPKKWGQKNAKFFTKRDRASILFQRSGPKNAKRDKASIFFQRSGPNDFLGSFFHAR